MKGFIWLLGALLPAFLYGQESMSLPLLGVPIEVYFSGSPTSPVALFNMHDNENTSAMAGRAVSQKYGGEYFELIHNGKRNISFQVGQDSVHIDPNRIFTDAGIWAQLERNKCKDANVFMALKSWRNSLLAILDLEKRDLVIALHNNTNQNYSFKSYMSGEEYENEAEDLHHGRLNDKDDFYFVTDPHIMNQLKTGRYNVILQANNTMTDDGSLSVYCAQLGIPYVNVEAQHDRLVRQIKMLIFVFQRLVHKE